jgi:hypothetical protein
MRQSNQELKEKMEMWIQGTKIGDLKMWNFL